MKKLLLLIAIFCLSFPLFAEENATDAEVTAMVDKAVSLIKSKGTAAFETINKKDGGFYVESKDLYVFVYNEQVEMLAHPFKPELVGKAFKGKPDVKGKMFRDEIVTLALSKGKGWVEYSYQKPGDPGIYQKVTYCKIAVSGGVKYIVCAGKYKDKK